VDNLQEKPAVAIMSANKGANYVRYDDPNLLNPRLWHYTKRSFEGHENFSLQNGRKRKVSCRNFVPQKPLIVDKI